MKRFIFFFSLLFCATVVNAQFAPPQSVAETDDIFSIRNNPAGLVSQSGSQFGVVAPLYSLAGDSLEFYLGSGMGNSAVGYSVRVIGGEVTGRFVSSFKIGSGAYVGYGIDFGRPIAPTYGLGMMFHPLEALSLGISLENLTGANTGLTHSTAGVALRPFGNRFTIGTDGIYTYHQETGDYETDARLYVSAEPVSGIRLNAHYTYESGIIGGGIGLNLGHHGIRGEADVAGDGVGDALRGTAAYHFSDASRRSVFQPVRQDKWVSLTLKGSLPEERPRFSIFREQKRKNLTDIVVQIDEYGKRDDIAGLVIHLHPLEGGLAKHQEIREALARCKKRGKKVYVYMEQGGNGAYYLASVADKVFLNPGGLLWLTGVQSQLVYTKNLLKKLGIEAEVVQIGRYKTAGESLTRDSASTAELEQLNDYFDTFYDEFTTAIAGSRQMSVDSVKRLVDSGPFDSRRAKSSGLVDSLIYADQLKEIVDGNGERSSLYSQKDFQKLRDWRYTWEPMLESRIAVIYAVGNIVPGKSNRSPFSGSNNMGAETIARAIESARENDQVKAIVLRVDSPGGSALASDIIWREVRRTTTGDDAKPFVVSMGDVAASGGYYISMAADTILADRGTLTGSIGVIAGTFNMSELLENIGVNTQVIKRGENADFLSPTKELTERDREKLRTIIGEMYEQFVEKASEGRDLPVDSLKQIARGRIYSGEDALANGLIDELGGIHDAVGIARKLAGIDEEEEVTLQYYPKYEPGVFGMFQQSAVQEWIQRLSPESRRYLESLEQARLVSKEQVLFLAIHLPAFKDGNW